MKTFILMAGLLLAFTAVPMRLPAKSPATAQMQQKSQSKSKTFTGTVSKDGDNFILSDSTDKASYVLDDPEIASQYVGKKVQITGTVIVASNTIHVETIQETT